MLALRSTLNRALAERDGVAMAYRQLQAEWTSLVRRVNALGGEQFLLREESALMAERLGYPREAKFPQLSDEDIKRLLMLCHPDKHGGKKMAEEMTQKLLAMRQR